VTQNDNPYEAPLAVPENPGISSAAGMEQESDETPRAESKGFPDPLVLGWIGVVLAIGVIGSLISAATTPSIFRATGLEVIPVLAAFAVPPLRLIWVIVAGMKRRRHEKFWSSGERTFVFSVWVINVILLCIDGLIILLFATCLVMILQ
jgi:hypothetical protein